MSTPPVPPPQDNSKDNTKDNAKDNSKDDVEKKDESLRTATGKSLNKLSTKQQWEIFGIREKDHKMKQALKKEAHKFWDTQPVPKLLQKIEEDGPIDPIKTKEEIRATPLPLPKGFAFCSVDIQNDKERAEVYKLLTQNYVEDDDNMFRFDYSEAFLLWALTPPGYHKDWHVGVRQVSNNRLRGFITGVPADMRVRGRSIHMAEINFLCVHKKLRDKRLAPVLIKEVTRRINRRDIWQAAYTAGVVLPKPVGRCQYWHRSLNPKKLIEVRFSSLKPRMTLARTIKLYRVPEKTQTKLRPMRKEDVPSACKLLNEYLDNFKLHTHFSEADFAHWLLPREGVIDTFVIESPTEKGKITDMVSFYHLPSTIIGHTKYKTLRAVYSFYNVATTVNLTQLMKDCLIVAKQLKADVVNALDLMENGTFLQELKFGTGDGHLQYYLYNWATPEMSNKEVGLVLL